MAVVLEHLLAEDALPAVLITLNPPEQRNALSTPLMLELTAELELHSGRTAGRKRALEMLLPGRPIDARTAAEWGLVNRVVPASELDAAALELANQVASASPLTLRIGKQAFYRQIDVDQHEAYRLMSRTMAENAMTGDAQEGMSAFLEKRAPTWRRE